MPKVAGQPRAQLDDATLLCRARQGNGIAFHVLVERHLAPVVLVAEALVPMGWQAEACAHAAFAEVTRAWPQLADLSSFRRHLYRAVLAQAMVQPSRRPPPLGGPRRLGAQLSAAARVAWALHAHAELSYQCIAEILGCRPVAVRRWLGQARDVAGQLSQQRHVGLWGAQG